MSPHLQRGSASLPQACLSSLPPLPPAHCCLGKAGGPERLVSHHSLKPLTPGSSAGFNLQGCRRSPILATERRQSPQRSHGKRAAAGRGRKEALGVAEGEDARDGGKLRGFLSHGVSGLSTKYANFGALRPTQKPSPGWGLGGGEVLRGGQGLRREGRSPGQTGLM